MRMALPEDKLCKDCVHLLPYGGVAGSDALRLATCAHTEEIVCLITGSRRHVFCENERSNTHNPLACGPNARHFQRDNSDVMP